ncbi:MAG: holo-[acyl-carrier-protein] synthase [Candidatus Woykebacteria bacterium GWB1_45_5]|uniref:Holo-[acyl-carrier-protein] synthase n=1 Tax=Candidatus Woykebacteria bacterium GWB1_45_5 TaxID=1802592 RepID=A0A1G1W868_9BACT|nr:MAG: holo-[acyl-carrier-protein] synthase [Candidatus Woykebacteria bacterium GWB1_45_5]
MKSLPKIGVDIVFIPRFKKILEERNEKFLSRVFQPSELKQMSVESLAGVFAAKEAVIKALSLPPESWLSIEISHDVNGAPLINLIERTYKKKSHLRLSMSHEKDYVVAVVLAS